MSTFRDAARSQYEQDNYDPESVDLTRCAECSKKYKNCKCPDQSPVIGEFVCRVCDGTFSEEWSGNDELHKECPSCHRKRVYPKNNWDHGDEILF
ncbi:MAG TPA: hypothetical protein VK308_09130 [Pyrinomonadaceae bacterium]|nr:hypothetical protein [Pyrinomonadaceae bacterium]